MIEEKEKSKTPELDIPMYAAAEAGRLVRLSSVRVRRWLQGYDYTYDLEKRHKRPVIRRRGTEGTSYASFLDLVDLLFVKRFLDYGFSLQKVRKALDEAARILDTDHFARRSFFIDSKNIYLKVKKEGDSILQLLSGGQWVIASIIRQLAHQIDFDASSGLACRWYPMEPKRHIVLDPLISFGRPIIAKKGIATSNIYDLFIAEKRKVHRVCSWMNVVQEEVEAAVNFEKMLAS